MQYNINQLKTIEETIKGPNEYRLPIIINFERCHYWRDNDSGFFSTLNYLIISEIEKSQLYRSGFLVEISSFR